MAASTHTPPPPRLPSVVMADDLATSIVEAAAKKRKKDRDARALRLEVAVSHSSDTKFLSPSYSFVVDVVPVSGSDKKQHLAIRYNHLEFKPVCADDDSAIDRVVCQMVDMHRDGFAYGVSLCQLSPVCTHGVIARLVVSKGGKEVVKARWRSDDDLQKLLSKYVRLAAGIV